MRYGGPFTCNTAGSVSKLAHAVPPSPYICVGVGNVDDVGDVVVDVIIVDDLRHRRPIST